MVPVFAPLAQNLGVVLYLQELALVLAMPMASEMGYRGGLWLRDKADELFKSQVGVVQGATFGILGLLAAFTLAMAQDRFTARRQTILDEANAIGTTYLRSQYLADPHPAELAPLFRSYVDARVAFYDASGDLPAVEAAVAEGERLQGQIWATAIRVVREDPLHGDTNSVFVESLNEMIDLENARVASAYARIPKTVMALVVLAGLFATATTGLACGLAGRRVWLSILALPILVGITIGVILDLDAPRLGFISTGQQPMLRLQQSMSTGP